ncbi:hypothetical protein BYT27DRAFT_7251513 [Phlegmacium glaucopus]|nr:hypothetical protein BYT27DRAFT_7251513 [Phlegmacium glaucopus]
MQGQRGAKKAPLPPGVEAHLDDNKVRCKICVKHCLILSPPDWITLKTFKNSHQKTATHLHCVGLQTREEEAEERQQQNAPNFFATPNNITPRIPPSGPSHQECQQQHELSQDIMQELWDQFDGTFELDQGFDEAHEKARKDFHEHGLWDGPEAMAADIDMNNVEQLWDEEDQDDLLSEILEQMGMNSTNVKTTTASTNTKW